MSDNTTKDKQPTEGSTSNTDRSDRSLGPPALTISVEEDNDASSETQASENQQKAESTLRRSRMQPYLSPVDEQGAREAGEHVGGGCEGRCDEPEYVLSSFEICLSPRKICRTRSADDIATANTDRS